MTRCHAKVEGGKNEDEPKQPIVFQLLEGQNRGLRSQTHLIDNAVHMDTQKCPLRRFPHLGEVMRLLQKTAEMLEIKQFSDQRIFLCQATDLNQI